MAKMLIDADELFKEFERTAWYDNADRDEIAELILWQMPTVDAVEYDVLREWLHEIAINNVNVPVTMDVACEIIVERFYGLRMYAREKGERRENDGEKAD